MRTRAYRPEVPGCLEDRSLLSGVAGHPAQPVVFSHSQFNLYAERMRAGFDLYVRYRDVVQLHNVIDDTVVMIPFGGVDGLEKKIDGIVDRMRDNLAAHVPLAIQSAFIDVIAVSRAEVEVRVQAGDVVIR